MPKLVNIDNSMQTNNKPNKILSDDFGLVFEFGVNVGILSGIQHLSRNKKIFSQIQSLYNQELKELKLTQVVSGLRNKAILNGVVDPNLLEKTETFIEYLIFLGIHKGFNFIIEYCQSLQNNKTAKPALLYYQCDLQQLFIADEAKRYDLLIPKLKEMFKQFAGQFPLYFQKYQQTGQFLKADIIMLFKLPDKYRVVVIDVGLFSVADISQVPDFNDVYAIKQRLISTYSYMLQKTAFEHLNIDSEKADLQFSKELADYFEAFSRNDKDSSKMIQAGGYTYSFVECLKNFPDFNDDNLEVNVIGLTDRAYNAMFITNKIDSQILRHIYRESKAQNKGLDFLEKRSIAIQSVFKAIYKNFTHTFKLGKFRQPKNLTAFLEQLQNLPASGINQITYTETLKDFQSTANNVPRELLTELGLKPPLTFRDAHAELIIKAMRNDDLLLFLTGHPGIGKTTAIVDYILKPEILSDGVLFFYFSPRIQVNNDIIEKFSRYENGKRVIKDDSLLCIYSNSALISNYAGQPVIKYVSNSCLPNQLKMPAIVGGRHSILTLVPETEKMPSQQLRSSQAKSISDNKIEHSRRIPTGVLRTLCSAICTLRSDDKSIPKNIIATATVQSLKKTQSATTAEHLKRIFAEAAQDKDLKHFDETKLARMAQTNRHLIFMVDELIGDSGGTALFHELVKMVTTMKLNQHFKVKIIASDASIAGIDVIKQHLSKDEPCPAKILYRHVDKPVDMKPLSFQQDNFKVQRFRREKATIINANTFPAGELVLNYKIALEMATMEAKVDYNKTLLWIQKDILELLQEKNGQIIVYIQNINKINSLINLLKSALPKGDFEEFKDYLQIHSIIPDETRKKIHQHKNQVKVIFMTSSASRGITFARVRHILLEVPKFQIENNLMEIVQTVYRGRGGETVAEKNLETQTRWLSFYINDVIRYSEFSQREVRYQRGITGVMNIILLLRAALKTRITGYAEIGRKRELRIIPVGEKHLDSVGDSLLTAVARLLTQIRREVNRSRDNDKAGVSDYDNPLAKLGVEIKNLFKNTETKIVSKNLAKLNSYYEDFAQQARRSFYEVLNYEFEPESYLDGDILTVPINSSEERIYITKDLLIATKTNKIVEKMAILAKQAKYSESLKKELNNVAKEIEKMQKASDETSNSQDVSSQNSSGNQYLSIPLPVFFKPQLFKQYFSIGSETRFLEEENELESFRNLLGKYLYLLYQLNNKLPLDGGYEEFPFLLFRCDNFISSRQQQFDRRYLFSSTTFNLINLVLSQNSKN